MRNTAVMAVSAFAMMGAGLLAGSFVAPAYSDGVVRHDEVRQGENFADSSVQYPAEVYPTQRYNSYDAQPGNVTIERETVQAGDTVAAYEEGIEVQARRLPNGAPVAVTGEITSASGKTLIIDRPDGRVHVRLPGAIPALARGDDVTVYGRLGNRSDRLAVQAEAVLQHTSFSTATLHMAPSKLESVNKRNISISRGAARNALDHYRFTYTAL